MTIRRTTRAIVAITVVVAAAYGAAPASAAAGGPVCYTNALTQEQMDAGARSVIRCYGSEEEMQRARLRGISTASFSNQRLARHYDANNGTGSSLSVFGVDCNGGGTSLNGTSWDNKISSTQHGACGSITHWATSNYTGTGYNTTGSCGAVRTMSVGLGGVNDDVSSIKYFTPEAGACNLP